MPVQGPVSVSWGVIDGAGESGGGWICFKMSGEVVQGGARLPSNLQDTAGASPVLPRLRSCLVGQRRRPWSRLLLLLLPLPLFPLSRSPKLGVFDSSAEGHDRFKKCLSASSQSRRSVASSRLPATVEEEEVVWARTLLTGSCRRLVLMTPSRMLSRSSRCESGIIAAGYTYYYRMD